MLTSFVLIKMYLNFCSSFNLDFYVYKITMFFMFEQSKKINNKIFENILFLTFYCEKKAFYFSSYRSQSSLDIC